MLGASGMIGSTMFRVLNARDGWEVWGSMRSESAKQHFSSLDAQRLITGIDLAASEGLIKILLKANFDVVVNCAGLTKHLPEGNDAYTATAMNALFPHQLARLCQLAGARLIHIGTDCVFAGTKGGYTEESVTDAVDVYGKTKSLGEVNCQGAVTLRISTIGHELSSQYGLLEWFLAQTSSCKGYTQAMFSGLPSVVFAQIVRDVVIPDPRLSGLYNVGAASISKNDLLGLIARAYSKNIKIIPDESVRIDRSLSSSKFQAATGYIAPAWPELVEMMHASYVKNGF